MIKTRENLSKKEKIILLQAITSGQLCKDSINDDTLFAFEYSDGFLALMVASCQVDDAEVTVICLGEAEKAMAQLLSSI